MAPNEPLVVTLEAQQWNQLLGLLGEVSAPHRIVDPLIRAVVNQLMAEQRQRPQPASVDEEDNVFPLGA